MKRQTALLVTWALALTTGLVLVAYAFVMLDVPLALCFWAGAPGLSSVGGGFSISSSVLLYTEGGAIALVGLSRLVLGRTVPFAQAVLIACLTSMGAYFFNDFVLKVIFGAAGPEDVLHGVRHVIHLLHGSPHSSLPSGHMVLASAFAGAFMQRYRWSILPLSLLLTFGCGLLVAGNWHFLSDVLAGTIVGVAAGIAVAGAWERCSLLAE